MNKVGVLIIHGMGNQCPSFAAELIDGISKKLGPYTKHVGFESCYWADLLQKYEDITWHKLKQSGNMTWVGLREWIVSALGDPVGYLAGYFASGKPNYMDIHKRISKSFSDLSKRLEQPSASPIIVLAHSLGSVIMSNYFWDEQSKKGIGKTPAERGKTTVKFITYGSNIPLFLPPKSPVECIQFPFASLAAKYKAIASWENIYSKADVLGYPLRDIWDILHGTNINDHAIHAGCWPLSRTPISHTKYDTSNKYLKIVCRNIREVLSLELPPENEKP